MTSENKIDIVLLRLRDVMSMTGLARSTIYKLMRVGAFPRPVKLAARAVAWRSDELRCWIEGRTEHPAGAAWKAA